MRYLKILLMSIILVIVFGCKEEKPTDEDIVPEFKHGMITGKVVKEEYQNGSVSFVGVADQGIAIGSYNLDSIITSGITNDKGHYCIDNVPVGLRDVWLHPHGYGSRAENLVLHENEICEVPDLLKRQGWRVFYGNLTMPSGSDTVLKVTAFVNSDFNFAEREEFSGQYHIYFTQDAVYQFKYNRNANSVDDTTWNVVIEGLGEPSYDRRRFKFYFDNPIKSCYNVNLNLSSIPAGSTVVITLPE